MSSSLYQERLHNMWWSKYAGEYSCSGCSYIPLQAHLLPAGPIPCNGHTFKWLVKPLITNKMNMNIKFMFNMNIKFMFNIIKKYFDLLKWKSLLGAGYLHKKRSNIKVFLIKLLGVPHSPIWKVSSNRRCPTWNFS